MIKIIKIRGLLRFSKNGKYLKTQNGSLLSVKRIKHAKCLVDEFYIEKKLKDPYSLVSLSYFSCDLDEKNVEQIKKKILEFINFDFVLYRCFDDIELITLMEKKFSKFVDKFEDLFNLNFIKVKKISDYNNVESLSFEKYLNKLDNFHLTTLYKLSLLTKSVILSYFFMNKKIDYNTLFKLSNLEYTYQQKRWGVVEEQKAIDKNFLEIIKNISIFLKNIN